MQSKGVTMGDFIDSLIIPLQNVILVGVKVCKIFKKMAPKNGVLSPFLLVLAKSSKPANYIFQPVCLWV